MLYEVNANTANWMIAGRKRGHVSLSPVRGTEYFLIIPYSALSLLDIYPEDHIETFPKNRAQLEKVYISENCLREQALKFVQTKLHFS